MMRHGVGWGSSVGAWMSSKPSIGVIPEAGGLEALVDRPRGPAPACLPDWVEQAVIVVRLLTYWNSKRLAAEFTRREIFPLDHHAVDHLLGDLGTARPSTRERGPAYERGRPNEPWHIAIKGPLFLRRSAREYEETWSVGRAAQEEGPLDGDVPELGGPATLVGGTPLAPGRRAGRAEVAQQVVDGMVVEREDLASGELCLLYTS